MILYQGLRVAKALCPSGKNNNSSATICSQYGHIYMNTLHVCQQFGPLQNYTIVQTAQWQQRRGAQQ